jgi:membrane protease YdiL (CAAX protease family)
MFEARLAAVLSVAALAVLHLAGRLAFLRQELARAWQRWLGLALLFAVLAAAVFYPVATAGDVLHLDPAAIAFPEIFSGHLLLVAFLVAWWALSGRPSWQTFLHLSPEGLGAAVRDGVVVGSLGWSATLLVTFAVAASAGAVTSAPLGPAEVPPIMLWMADLPVWRKALIVGAAMSVEEAFFRGFLQTRLGLPASTLLFALAHVNYGLPFMVVAVLTISVILGALFALRRNLVSCVIAHGVFDAIQIFVIIPFAVRQLTST